VRWCRARTDSTTPPTRGLAALVRAAYRERRQLRVRRRIVNDPQRVQPAATLTAAGLMREERAFHRSGASRPDSDHLATGREEIALALGSADAIHDLTGRLARGQGRYALGASACEQPPRRPGLSAPIMDKRERGRSRVRRGAALSTFAPGRRPKGAASLWSRSCTTVEHSAICGPEKRRRHLPADPRVIDDFAYTRVDGGSTSPAFLADLTGDGRI
jgi:hypothetical protein